MTTNKLLSSLLMSAAKPVIHTIDESITQRNFATYFQPGDVITIYGVYEKRTLWQWLTRKPRQYRKFVVQPGE